MHLSKSGAFVGGIVFAVVVGGGTAVATNGGSLLIGKPNSATATTGLTNSKGTPLSLVAKKGTAPLKVSNSVKVKNLDSDLLDGKDSTAFLGKSASAADSAKLGGLPPANYLTTTGTAADSTKLGGLPASSYVGAVYAAQTYYNTSPLPKLNSSAFDTIALPAGTYLVALTADLSNGDNVPGEFGCHVQATVPGSSIEGEYGNVSLNPAPSAATFGATAVSQIMAFPVGGSVYAYCYSNSGDASHTAYVYDSSLIATRIQSLNGSVPAARPAFHGSVGHQQPTAGH